MLRAFHISKVDTGLNVQSALACLGMRPRMRSLLIRLLGRVKLLNQRGLAGIHIAEEGVGLVMLMRGGLIQVIVAFIISFIWVSFLSLFHQTGSDVTVS